MNDVTQTSATDVETPPAHQPPLHQTPAHQTPAHKDDKLKDGHEDENAHAKDASADASNQGHNGNPAQSAGRVTAEEQDTAPDAKVDFEGKEAKHVP